MIPMSGGVLLVAALLTSPALWSTLVEGTMPLHVGLTRYLLATGVCWVVLSVVSELVWPEVAPAAVEADEDEHEGTDVAH
jgi:thiosulfate reductase cytochrome b subunit